MEKYKIKEKTTGPPQCVSKKKFFQSIEPITNFKKYPWLLNSYKLKYPFVFNQIRVKSVEAVMQIFRCKERNDKMAIATCKSDRKRRKLFKAATKIEDWDLKKEAVSLLKVL